MAGLPPAATTTTIQATSTNIEIKNSQISANTQVAIGSSKSSSKLLLSPDNNQNREEDKRDSSFEAQSEGSRGPDNFGVLARKEKAKTEKEHRFANKDLEEKTQALQSEFEQILQELNDRRNNRNGE